MRARGSVPVAPLVDIEMCDAIIVVHATDGSMWDRRAFPIVPVFEIRPMEGLERQGYLRDTLSLDRETLSAGVGKDITMLVDA